MLEAATEALEEVTVRAVRKMNSEVAMVNTVKASPVVMSGLSQLITKSQGGSGCFGGCRTYSGNIDYRR